MYLGYSVSDFIIIYRLIFYLTLGATSTEPEATRVLESVSLIQVRSDAPDTQKCGYLSAEMRGCDMSSAHSRGSVETLGIQIFSLDLRVAVRAHYIVCWLYDKLSSPSPIISLYGV